MNQLGGGLLFISISYIVYLKYVFIYQIYIRQYNEKEKEKERILNIFNDVELGNLNILKYDDTDDNVYYSMESDNDTIYYSMEIDSEIEEI